MIVSKYVKISSMHIKEIIKVLNKKYKKNKTALNYSNVVQLLVATILSAQCTDKMVNKVTENIFKKYKTAKDFADSNLKVFEQEIKPTGFYKNKAKNIIACCKELLNTHKGRVPKTLDLLVKLPGVGRKTANVVLGNAFGIPGVIVDTHVKRLSYRLGLTKNTNPEKIEFDLMKIIPKKEWTNFSNALVLHGRETCMARKPRCNICILEKFCPKVGL
jgi:endonuclease-3